MSDKKVDDYVDGTSESDDDNQPGDAAGNEILAEIIKSFEEEGLNWNDVVLRNVGKKALKGIFVARR